MINNDFYDTLKEDWYTATDHPIALLRRENAARIPWISEEIKREGKNSDSHVLDIGCGGGFLTNELGLQGYSVTGIDLSESSLAIARKYDVTKKVNYLKADAYSLPFPDQSFDVVCAMDILEHVDNPQQLIKEASRVLRPGGLFFFHTFNRNLLSYILIIKGVDWFVSNAPKNMHVYPLFIKPKELRGMLEAQGLQTKKMLGFVPDFFTMAFWKLLMTRRVPKDFKFRFCKNLFTGYCGVAFKQERT